MYMENVPPKKKSCMKLCSSIFLVLAIEHFHHLRHLYAIIDLWAWLRAVISLGAQVRNGAAFEELATAERIA